MIDRPPTGSRQSAVSQPASSAPADGSPDLLAAKDATIARLTEEVGFLRDRLDHSRRALAQERERCDGLRREVLERHPTVKSGPHATGPSATRSAARQEPFVPSVPAWRRPPGPLPSIRTPRRPWWRRWIP